MKALVVDDNKSNLHILEILLKQNGYTVYMAKNGLEGVELFKCVKPDIILIDIMMPVMNGYEATRLIKEHSGDNFVPVIVLSSLSAPEDIAMAIESGADDFLTKPVHHLILKTKILAMERLKSLYHNQKIQNIKLQAAIEELRQSKQQLEKYSNELESSNAKLELLNNKINQEHDAASNIFQKVLQHNDEICPNIKSIITPLEVFSGDIVMSRRKPSGGCYLLLGDFAGHGLLAATGAMPVLEIFNRMADSNQPISDFVYEINGKLKKLLSSNIFLCASILEIDCHEGLVTVWNGGLPDILFVEKNGGIKHKMSSMNLPLGILENNKLKCELQKYKCTPEDHIYIFSDGVTETFNHKNEMYGQERLENHFRQDTVKPNILYNKVGVADYEYNSVKSKYQPDKILEQIKQSIDAFRGNVSQQDDITMVQITYHPYCREY
ncbi:MAG: SpoIIE family protein phosphatase [Desulfamplus sp.]|nr:SpoIIE family protein phosphatase [Desulfamplus sp.]